MINIELSKEDIQNIIAVINDANIKGSEAIKVVLLLQKLTTSLAQSQRPETDEQSG